MLIHNNNNNDEVVINDQIQSDDIETTVSYSIPKKVTLSWKSVNVKTSTGGLLRKIKSKVILDDVHGVVEPGQMVALMGARYKNIINLKFILIISVL
jgi:hypothetical protein